MGIRDLPILSIVIFMPLLGSLPLFFVKKERVEFIRGWALFVTILTFFTSLSLYFNFDQNSANFQFQERISWIHELGISYHVGIDGISLWLLLLTTFLGPITVLCSWSAIMERVRDYMICLLILETGILGVFSSLDLFLFYVFWESQLIPMYLLIGIWGSQNRIYAALKFVIYTMAGSLMMLVAIMYLYFYHKNQAGFFSMNLLDLYNLNIPYSIQLILFIAFFLAFAFKVPMFPFHTWLPDAHVEAPTAISVILAGILLKMGTYGLYRISYPILPEATVWFSYPLAILGAINIIWGALCAMAQQDMKKLVAYSSISHMGVVLLGMASLTPAGMNGGLFQMFNHGTVTAMLFLLTGVIYDRAHHRDIDRFGGLAVQMPIYAGITSLAFFAGLGLPGLNSFISEALCFLGAFNVYRWTTAIATSGIVFTAGYFLWTYQRMFLGPLNTKYSDLPEINGRELFTLIPLGAIVVFLGIYPSPVLNMMTITMYNLIVMVKP